MNKLNLDYIVRLRQVAFTIKKKTTVKALSEFFSITERTAQEDIFTLRKMGAKIEYDAKLRKYKYIERFNFDKMLISYLKEEGKKYLEKKDDKI